MTLKRALFACLLSTALTGPLTAPHAEDPFGDDFFKESGDIVTWDSIDKANTKNRKQRPQTKTKGKGTGLVGCVGCPTLKKSKGLRYYHQGRYQEALSFFRGQGASKQSAAENQFLAGATLFKMGRTQDALVEFRRSLKTNSANPNAHYGIAQAQFKLGHFQDAILHYRKVIRMSPRHTSAKTKLEEARSKVEKVNLLKLKAEDAIRNNKKDPRGHMWMGQAEGHAMNWEKSIGHYKKAAHLSPMDVAIHMELADVYERAGRRDDAEKRWREAVRLESRHGPANFRLAQFLQQAKKYKEARTHLFIAIETEPENGEYLYVLSQVLKRLGKREDSIRAIFKSCTLGYAQACQRVQSLKKQGVRPK